MNAKQRRVALRRWFRLALAHAFAGHAELPPVEHMPLQELLRLPVYTFFPPTRVTPGQRWRSDLMHKLRVARRAPPGTRPARWMARRHPDQWVLARVLDEPHPDGSLRIAWSLWAPPPDVPRS